MGHKDSSRIPTPSGGRTSVQKLRARRHAQVLIIGGGINGVGSFRGLVTGGRLNEVADILSGPPGRDRAVRASEISDGEEVLKRFHGVRVHSLVT